MIVIYEYYKWHLRRGLASETHTILQAFDEDRA